MKAAAGGSEEEEEEGCPAAAVAAEEEEEEEEEAGAAAAMGELGSSGSGRGRYTSMACFRYPVSLAMTRGRAASAVGRVR